MINKIKGVEVNIIAVVGIDYDLINHMVTGENYNSVINMQIKYIERCDVLWNIERFSYNKVYRM